MPGFGRGLAVVVAVTVVVTAGAAGVLGGAGTGPPDRTGAAAGGTEGTGAVGTGGDVGHGLGTAGDPFVADAPPASGALGTGPGRGYGHRVGLGLRPGSVSGSGSGFGSGSGSGSGTRRGVSPGTDASGTGSTVGGEPGAPAAADDADTIRLRTTLRRTDSPGEYAARTRAELPDRVTGLEVTLPPAARDVRADGFDRTGDRTWAWDGETADPRLDYRMPANRTADRDDPLSAGGSYLFVGVGDWALVQPPAVGAGWEWTGGGTVRLARETAVDGEGVAGGAMAFLGPHRLHTREAHGQAFRLVVPAAADLDEPPGAVLGALSEAADDLRVGDRDPAVLFVAAPTGRVEWAVLGLQIGPADAWVRDDERLDEPESVWLHEYVHTRQDYDPAASGRWFTEASATYYALLLTLDRGGIDFETFRAALARGEESPAADAVLADPATWRGDANYLKGALVAGELDRRLRLATDGGASLAAVFRGLNAAGSADADRFLELVGEAAAAGDGDGNGAGGDGGTVRARAERLTTTRETATAWDGDAHAAAFGRPPARIGHAFADDGPVRVVGPYRDRPVARDPVVLVPGETLVVAIAATNAGGTAGEYDLTLAVDGERVAERSGRLPAGETTVERFERAFDRPGEYALSVGGLRLSVVVVEPATPAVTGLSVEPDRVTAGDTVTVRATVENAAGIPGERTVTVAVDGEPAGAETVRLDAGGRRTVTLTPTLAAAGEATVAVGTRSRTVTVEPRTPTPGAPGESAPGFGVAAGLLALAAAATAIAAVARGRGGRWG